jgi:hypothetical protein
VDAVSEAVSVGVTNPGQVMMMYGSTIIVLLVLDKPVTDTQLWCNPYILPGTYCSIAGMATSGSLTRWFRDQVGKDLVAAETAGGANAYGELVKEAQLSRPVQKVCSFCRISAANALPSMTRAPAVCISVSLWLIPADICSGRRSRGSATACAITLTYARSQCQDHRGCGGRRRHKESHLAASDQRYLQDRPAGTGGHLWRSYGDAFMAGLGVGAFKSAQM